MIALLCMTWLGSSALAHPLPDDRPFVPSAGVAMEPGPLSSWINPSITAYNPDRRYGAIASFDARGRRSIGLAAGIGGASLGIAALQGAEGPTRWIAQYSTGLELPGRIAIGTSLSWHLAGGSGNHVAVDLGWAWRPRPWLGVGGALRNVGAPDPRGQIPMSALVGLTLRPARDRVLLGLDLERRGGPSPQVTGRLSARLRPTPGLFVRAHTDSRLSFGLGVEAYFGGHGAGLHATAGQSHAPIMSALIGTDRPGESLIGPPLVTRVLDLTEDIPYSPRSSIFIGDQPGWLQTLQRLQRLTGDDRPRALLIKLGGARISWARRAEIRRAMAALRTRGIPVIAWLDSAVGAGDIWLASGADRVIAHPAAEVALVGPHRSLTYVQGFLDRLGVRFEILRRGHYKSAVETTTRAGPSDATLEQEGALLDQLYATLVRDLAAGRVVDEETARSWFHGPWTAAEAVDLGLVDELVWPDELPTYTERFTQSPARLHSLHDLPEPHSGWDDRERVAVVLVEGLILPGASRSGWLGPATSGSETIARQLTALADDRTVRAVVLRVDSPGGSLYAAEEIWRAIHQVRAAGKPVVVSMGGVAASGGYFIATAGDAIWAEASTITGSIGIYLQKPDLSGALAELGIARETLERGGGSRLDITRPLDTRARDRFDAIVGAGYERFKQRVAEGRGLPPEAVEAAASGRVWSGTDARHHQLVDHLGGLLEAIADARDRANIDASAPATFVRFGISPALQRLAPVLSTQADALRDPYRGRVALPEPLRAIAGEIALLATLQGEGLWMVAPFDPEVR